MTRRKLTVVAAVAAVVVAAPALAFAALSSDDHDKPAGFLAFCAEAQKTVANVDGSALGSAGLTITSTVYDDEDDFVLSKSAVDVDAKEIVTTSHVEYADGARVQPKMHRCKLRTGESLTAGAWPAGSQNNSGRFEVDPHFGFGSAAAGVSTSAEDQECRAVNEHTVSEVWAGLTSAQRAAAPFSPEGDEPTLVTVPDVVAGSGPEWTAPTEPVELDGDTLNVWSRSLVVPTGSAGVPRFEGAHYCTLVAPSYLRSILLGDVTVD